MSDLRDREVLSALEGVGAVEVRSRSLADLRQFRILEPALVSIADKQSTPPESHWVLGVAAYDQTLGMISCIVDLNAVKKEERCKYGRIDLVIVRSCYRGLGVSRVMLLIALLEMLTRQSGKLYSISCLAGHAAIAHMLEQFGFSRLEKPGEEFIREEYLLVDDRDEQMLRERLVSELADTVRLVNYRLRQRREELK
jgi:predicted GNAT family N-acyltransferase